MFLLVRNNSPYTISSFLLGVFDSKEVAEQSKQIYINKRSECDIFAEQAYHVVNLKDDVYTYTLSDIQIIDNYAKIWVQHLFFQGEELVTFHKSEQDISPTVFPNCIQTALYEINTLYDELGKFSKKLPDTYTQESIDRYRQDDDSDSD